MPPEKDKELEKIKEKEEITQDKEVEDTSTIKSSHIKSSSIKRNTPDFAGQTSNSIPTEDPEKPKVTEEQKQELQKNYTPSEAVTGIDFKKGGVFEGIDSTGRRTADQGVVDVNKALNRFKELNPNASANDINAAGEKIAKALEGRIVSDPKKESFFIRGEEDKAKETFNTRVSRQLAADYDNNLKRQVRDNTAAALDKVDQDFGSTLISIHDNPNNVEVQLDSFKNTFIKEATEAGISPKKIQEVIDSRSKSAYTVSIQAKINKDPYEANDFIRKNIDKLGKNGVGLLVQAENAIKSLETKRKYKAYSTQVKEAKTELPLLFEDVAKISKEDSVLGDAARERTELFNKDPAAYAQETRIVRYSDVSSPEEMIDRVDQVKLGSETIGKNLPILTKEEVSEIQQNKNNSQFMQEQAEIFSVLKRDDLYRIAQQIGTGAEAIALTLPKGQEALRAEILKGLSTDVPSDSSKKPSNRLFFPHDSIRNQQVNKAVDALMKTGLDQEEAIEKVTNIQNIGSFFGGFDVPLPMGVEANQFEEAVEKLFTSEALLKKFGNGNPKKLKTETGEQVELDTDLQWVPTTRGRYAIYENDLPVINEDGTLFELRMEDLILGEQKTKINQDPLEQIQEDYKAYRDLKS